MNSPQPRLLGHRYFFALKPEPVMARRTAAFAQERLGPQGLLAADRLHVTLALTEDRARADDALVAALRRAGDAVRAAPFDLLLDRLSHGSATVALRPGRTSPPLQALQAGIAGAMAREGIAMRADWRFSPHETLCYRKGPSHMEAIEGFVWHVRDFVLVHSLIGLTRHETIACWPLRAPVQAQGQLL